MPPTEEAEMLFLKVIPSPISSLGEQIGHRHQAILRGFDEGLFDLMITYSTYLKFPN